MKLGGSIGRTFRPVIRGTAVAVLGLCLAAGPTVGSGSAPSPTRLVAAPAASNAGPTMSLAAGVPPRPTHVTLKVLKTVRNSNGNGYVRIRITWREPAGVATRFKVLGLLRCVNESARTDGKPCVVGGMHLRTSDFRVLGTYRGSARSATLSIPVAGETTTNALWGGSDYYGLLLGAYNARGGSLLTIVKSSTVCFGCTY